MRWAIAVLLLLNGCVGFHPLHPKWNQPDEPAPVVDASVRAVPESPWQVIGQSHQGRPLRIRRIGNGPRRVIWVGGIHGDEREGAISTAELPLAFSRLPGALGQVTLTILEDVNPDGTALHRRGNAEGIDLNRNYPASNFLAGPNFGERPLDQPEAKVLHDLILAERPHLVIVAHSWRKDHFINFDGPSEHLARRFGELSGYAVVPSENIHGTPGSLGSFVGIDRRTPILTLEYERGRSPDRCWSETREAILAVMGGDTGSGS